MKAYLTTHHLYNSGSLYGAWISLPIDDDGRAAIERIKAADRKAGGDAEMLIADTDGPDWLGRTNSLEELSDQVAWYESLDDDEQDAADALLTELSQDTVERIIRDGDYILLEFDWHRCRSFEEQFGRYLLQQGRLAGMGRAVLRLRELRRGRAVQLLPLPGREHPRAHLVAHHPPPTP